MNSLIVAMSINKVIGNNGQLPWNEPEDLKHFKRVTKGHPIIMGRKTHESIGRVLPGRLNIVVSRQDHESIDVLVYTKDIFQAICLALQHDDQPMIIGGAEIYRQAIPHVDRMFITEVQKVVKGDTYFPEYEEHEWREKSSSQAPGLIFKTLVRR